MGLNILEFPEQNYDYICEDCETRHSSYLVHSQIVGFICMNCGSNKLDRIIDKKIIPEV
ncbi:hypothetical protein LCGC14_1031910 [marine sediment metagenome]|uniref:Uncharacterized protein n=1 Tax=marine sediment metagenome TaxID=412755 RepID=A0A0F9QCG9_9ZZZZ